MVEGARRVVGFSWVIAVSAFLSAFGAAPAAADEGGFHFLYCSSPQAHGTGGEPPHVQGTGSSEDDACHGKGGDDGSCSMMRDPMYVSVSCWVGPSVGGSAPKEHCMAFLDCDNSVTGPTASCGGIGYEAFAGYRDSDGTAFIQCQGGATNELHECN